MNPGRYNLTIYKGTTFDLKPQWLIGGTPVILDNYAADMQVRYAPDTVTIVELSTSNGRITIDPPSGTVSLHLSATETAALPAGTYQYDLNLTNNSDGSVYKILQGVFAINESITI